MLISVIKASRGNLAVRAPNREGGSGGNNWYKKMELFYDMMLDLIVL
jgi:hypothetical protein